MRTSKARLPSSAWCRGYDQGYGDGARQCAAVILERLAVLRSDVRLSLHEWTLTSLLREIEALIDESARAVPPCRP